MYNHDMNTNTITIKKDSNLTSIYASGKLTAIQKKAYNAFIYVAKKLLKDDKNKHIFEMRVVDLKEMINDKSTSSTQLKNNIRVLQDMRVEYNILKKGKEISWDGFHLMAGVKIKDGIIKFNFAFQVLELIQNPSIYAYLDLRIIKQLENKHSISLYEILKDYVNLKNITFKIEEFKKAIDLQEIQYSRFNNFRDRVLTPAIEEINSKTDLKVSYEKISQGRKVTHLKFFISEKKAKKKRDVKGLLSKTLNNITPREQNKETNLYKFYGKSFSADGFKFIIERIEKISDNEFDVYAKNEMYQLFKYTFTSIKQLEEAVNTKNKE